MTPEGTLAAVLSSALGEGRRTNTLDDGSFDHVSMQVEYRSRGHLRGSLRMISSMPSSGGRKLVLPRDGVPRVV
jgi:hypothetical protein